MVVADAETFSTLRPNGSYLKLTVPPAPGSATLTSRFIRERVGRARPVAPRVVGAAHALCLLRHVPVVDWGTVLRLYSRHSKMNVVCECSTRAPALRGPPGANLLKDKCRTRVAV